MRYFIEHKQQMFYGEIIDGLTPLPHIHSHLEMIYLKEGSTLAIADNKKALQHTGDLYLAFPNQIHSYYDQAPVHGIMLIFSADLFRDLREPLNKKVPVSPVIAKPNVSFDLTDLMETILAKSASDSPYDRAAAVGYLQALLGELLSQMDLVPKDSDQDSVKRILHYCTENYTEPLTLDDISDALHLSKYYISHVFKERMDMSFLTFLNSMRTEHACDMLKRGIRITDVAFSSGFSSVRTFNRIFLENTGMTPREYRRVQE